jgi:hypothetical protein
MHIERTHEDPYQQFWSVDILMNDIVDAYGSVLLNGYDRFKGFDLLDIHHSPIRRTNNIITMRGMSRGISKKPYETPVSIGKKKKREQERCYKYQESRCLHALSFRT